MYEDRILSADLRKKVMSAEAAADFVKSGMTISASGFGRIGYPKAVPMAIACKGDIRDLTLICGSSVGDELDGELAKSGAMSRRYLYQTQTDVRKGINDGTIHFADTHLSRLSKLVRSSELGKLDIAILECCLVLGDGSIVPTLSVGSSDVFAECAEQVILELNLLHPTALYGLHDIAGVAACESGMRHASDRMGSPTIRIDPARIAAIVITEIPDQNPVYVTPDEQSQTIASLLIDYLDHEIRHGRLTKGFSLQSGVGAVANAVLTGLAGSHFRQMPIFTEVIQDGALRLLELGVAAYASGTSLNLSREAEAHFYKEYAFFRDKIILRPLEISNCHTLIRRFDVVAMNTAVEMDIYGNVNSTHVAGTHMLNGIGGSADFARNAELTFFITPSVTKNGDISCIIPMVTHVDHTEHEAQILVTEQGIADLRGLSPKERARRVIENCCHPDYRPELRAYFDRACAMTGNTHTPHDLQTAFAMHTRYRESGTMKATKTTEN